MAHAQMHVHEIANHRVVMQLLTVSLKNAQTLRPIALFYMTETKGKYVTRKKRIRQLEKEIEQLKTQVLTLTELLDNAHGMIYRSRPGLARAVEQDFHKVVSQKLVKISDVSLIIGRRYPIIDIETGMSVYYYLHSQVGEYCYWVRRL